MFLWNLSCLSSRGLITKANIAREHRPSQKGKDHLPTIIFQRQAVSFRECIIGFCFDWWFSLGFLLLGKYVANIFGLSTFAKNSQHQDDITCLGWGISSLNPSFATTAGKGGQSNPIGSMYGIFTCIYHKHQPNVGIYIYTTWILWELVFTYSSFIHELPFFS